MRQWLDALGPLMVIAVIVLPGLCLVRRFHAWKVRKLTTAVPTTLYRPNVPPHPVKSHAQR